MKKLDIIFIAACVMFLTTHFHLVYADEECNEHQFECLNRTRKECISKYSFCDSRPTCSDGSDEVRFNSSLHPAEDGLPCRNQVLLNNICLLPASQAYKKRTMCRNNPTCLTEFKCADGSQCLINRFFCDGHKGCRDGSDEVVFDSTRHKPEDGVPCRNYDKLKNICLLPNEQVHKKIYICRPDTKCSDDEFACDDGEECVHFQFFCNGYNHCRDGSDEIRFDPNKHTDRDGIPCRNKDYVNNVCLLPWSEERKKIQLCRPEATCNEDEFLCADGSRCVLMRHFCDGITTCGDGSDEIEFDSRIHTEKNGIQCRPKRNPKNTCLLPFNQRKKWYLLCESGCNDEAFECGDGTCVQKLNFCDGFMSCPSENPNSSIDEVRYNSTFNATQYGIPCRNVQHLGNVCVLPWGQSHKTSLCRSDAICRDDEFLCTSGDKCIPRYKFCDKFRDCGDTSDEIGYSELFDGHSEIGVQCRNVLNCLLPADQAHKAKALCYLNRTCEANEFKCADDVCLEKYRYCDGVRDCRDGSDEVIYNSSVHTGENEILCQRVQPCVLQNQFMCDGEIECANKADECFCGENRHIVDEDKNCFRCLNDLQRMSSSKVCDGKVHCSDLSDECLCWNLKGRFIDEICGRIFWKEFPFSKKFTCGLNSTYQTLDVNKICDGRIDCTEGIDEDRRICRDLSPGKECRGEDESALFQSSLPKCDFTCYISAGVGTGASLCNGRPTCAFLSDECGLCFDPAEFCQHWDPSSRRFTCLSGTYVGWSSVCDGKADCDDKTDELFCPHKFNCEGGSPVNVPKEKQCDLYKDCDDASDELYCKNERYETCENLTNHEDECDFTHFYCEDKGKTIFVDRKNKVCDGIEDCKSGVDECQNCTQGVFSSDNYLISTKVLIPPLWLISSFAVLGNLFVIGYTITVLVREYKEMNPARKSQNILVLNLAMADFLVGIYTMSMCILNEILSRGRYCRVDHAWRSSSACSALGAIVLIGSEESVLSLTIITAVRLHSVMRPFARMSVRLIWILLGVSWLISGAIALLPLAGFAENFFVESIWYPKNIFVTKVDLQAIPEYTRRILALQNTSQSFIKRHGQIGSWSLLEALMRTLNPGYVARRKFGYYSTHGVCLPRLFPSRYEDASWGFSLFYILLNFLAFFFIFIGYILIYKMATKKTIAVSSTAKRASSLQKRVTRIVVTDFLCWIPICAMTFVKLAGGNIPKEVYVPSGMILIPINSAINPLLFSDAQGWIQTKLSPVFAPLRSFFCNGWKRMKTMTAKNEGESNKYLPQGKDRVTARPDLPDKGTRKRVLEACVAHVDVKAAPCKIEKKVGPATHDVKKHGFTQERSSHGVTKAKQEPDDKKLKTNEGDVGESHTSGNVALRNIAKCTNVEVVVHQENLAESIQQENEGSTGGVGDAGVNVDAENFESPL